MKKFLSLIVGLVLSLSAYSQYSQAKIDYPKFETDSNGQQALTVGSSVALNLYPEGADSGDYYWSGTALVTGESHAVSLDDTIKSNFSAQGTGVLTRTTV